METAGYSGKALWQKLGLSPGGAVCVLGWEGDYTALVGVQVVSDPAAGWVHAFVTTEAELVDVVARLARSLPPDGTAWISWPKRASGVATTVTEDDIRAHALPTGLVDVKVCAVDAIWSGLKLVWRRSARSRRLRASQP